MFDTHAQTLFVWVALAAVGVAVLGTVVSMPTTAPPDASAAAATVDEVATSPPGSVAVRDVHADSWSLSDRQLGLRSDGGTSHATLLRPAVPALGGRLAAVARGRPPATAFRSVRGFERAVTHARERGVGWRPAPTRLTVRHVAWGGVDVTLVG
ncbi:DUF7283 family protein [Haloarcula litorea]|uniref:DUF7283 family protein n=1 Tax=Haloarcula litorea TaxID=3032579 RepID=UPI0023E79F29|nr:hypothetical protein [Halomicroarcula sp. GDY20]